MTSEHEEEKKEGGEEKEVSEEKNLERERFNNDIKKVLDVLLAMEKNEDREERSREQAESRIAEIMSAIIKEEMESKIGATVDPDMRSVVDKKMKELMGDEVISVYLSGFDSRAEMGDKERVSEAKKAYAAAMAKLRERTGEKTKYERFTGVAKGALGLGKKAGWGVGGALGTGIGIGLGCGWIGLKVARDIGNEFYKAAKGEAADWGSAIGLKGGGGGSKKESGGHGGGH